MFQSILRRAQDAVESSIDQAVNRALMTVPFVIAGGFGTAALAYRLNRELGPELGNLVMGGLFAAIGLIILAVTALRQPALHPASGEAEATADSSAAEASQEDAPVIGEAEQEMLSAAVRTIAPLALPQMLGIAMRNLPLLAVILAGLLLLARSGEETTAAAEPQPSPS